MLHLHRYASRRVLCCCILCTPRVRTTPTPKTNPFLSTLCTTGCLQAVAFGLPLWPFKLGIDLLKVLLLSAVEDSAGLTQQLWLGHVQPQPVREDLERKVGVSHGLTITVNLQQSKPCHLHHGTGERSGHDSNAVVYLPSFTLVLAP